MENNKKDLSAKQVRRIFIIIITLFFLLFLAITIFNATRPNPYGESTAIDGLSSIGMSVDDQDQVTAGLYSMIKSHMSVGDDVPTSGAKIREGSIEMWYNEEERSNVVDFIVDIEAIRQSYNIHVEWSGDKNFTSGYPYVITCVSREDAIYPEFACTDDFTVSDLELVQGSLPYWGETESGYEYMVLSKKDTEDEFYFEIDVNACGDQEIMNEALESAKNWINSFGVSSDDFTYYLPDYLCDGSAE